MGKQLRSDPIRLFEQLKTEQGDVAYAHVGRRRIVLVSHPDDVRNLLVAGARGYVRELPDRAWRKDPPISKGDALLGLGGELDSVLAVRRTLQPAYGRQRIEQRRPVLVERAHAAVARWKDGSVLDILRETDRIATELLLDLLFGGGRGDAIDDHLDDIEACVAVRSPLGETHLRHFMRSLHAPRILAAARAHDNLTAFVRNRFDEARFSDSDDVFSLLGRTQRAGLAEGFQLETSALSQLFALITTGSTAAWALLLLAKHPAALRGVRSEVLHQTREESAHAVAFTHSVLREALRLYPGGVAIFRQAQHDDVIRRLAIRRGDYVCISQAVLHRDERWWIEPERFLPERWLGASANPEAQHRAFIPFGVGPRMCIGAAAAWAVLEEIVRAVAAHWNLIPLARPSNGLLRPEGAVVRVERLQRNVRRDYLDERG